MSTENDAQTLESATAEGRPVRRRLATPKAVREVIKKFDDDDSAGDATRRAIIQGMIDGNPPYRQKDLDDAGLGSLTNVNFMSLSANLNARVTASHELLAEVPTLVEVLPSIPDPEDQLAASRCCIIREEFSTAVMDWVGFLPMLDMVIRETDAYGIGPVMFRDGWDWRPKAFKRGNLRVEPRAKVVVDDNELVVVRDELTAGELFDIIEDEEAARLAGWKVNPVRDLLAAVFGKKEGASADQQDTYQRSTWESIQQAMRNNDPAVQAKEFDRIGIRHVLVREVSGKRGITHLILAEDVKFDFFLFEKVERFEKLSHVLWWLPANYGDGYVKSVRGVASWMAKHDDLSNRFLCRVFDAGFLTSGMVLQPQQGVDLARLEFIQHGPWTILPSELNAVQSTFMPQVSQLVQLREVSESIMKNNTGTYRRYDEAVQTGGDRKTARQVVEESSREQRYEKAEIAFRYQHFDALYTEMFRRITSEEYVSSKLDLPGKDVAVKFLERCEKRGVKRSDIVGKADAYSVKAMRALGLGSLGVKYDLTNQILGARPMLDSIGQQNALRDWLAVRVGYRNVDRYVKAVNRDLVPSNEMSHAVLENNDLVQGQAVQVGSDQLHKVHINVVLQGVILPIIDAVSKNGISDPLAAYKTLSVAVPHVQEHLSYVEQDKAQTDYVKQVQDVIVRATVAFKQLEAAVRSMQQEAAKQRAEQQQTVEEAQQVLKDRELEAKVYEIQKKYELEVMKQQSHNEVRKQKMDDQSTLANERASRDDARRDAMAAAEIRRRDAIEQSGKRE